jgi:hypothetical protein
MTVALTAGGASSGVARAEECAPARPALGGVWQLNSELSTRPEADLVVKPAGQAAVAAAAWVAAAWADRAAAVVSRNERIRCRRARRATRRRAKRRTVQAMRETMQELLQPATRLTIVQPRAQRHKLNQGPAAQFSTVSGVARGHTWNSRRRALRS